MTMKSSEKEIVQLNQSISVVDDDVENWLSLLTKTMQSTL